MADITVRRLRFEFDPDDIVLDVPDRDFTLVMGALGISLTMPYLEPYLIRTMKVALPRVTDETLAEDVRRFSQQESHHYRNHAVLNRAIRERFPEDVAEEILATERALEADYQRFTRDESLRFNLAYAEGFEAMTCALALAGAQHDVFRRVPGQDLFTWHMAEEIEHRTVAFQLFEHLVGSYFYRLRAGSWAQWHYLRFTDRFARIMANSLGRKLRITGQPYERTGLRNWLRTYLPWYDPANIEVPSAVPALLAKYDERALAQ